MSEERREEDTTTHRRDKHEPPKRSYHEEASEERADGAARRHELGVGERRPITRRRGRSCTLTLKTREREQTSSTLDEGAVNGAEKEETTAKVAEAVHESMGWGACAEYGGERPIALRASEQRLRDVLN